MTPEIPNPDYKGVMQDMSTAFQQRTPYTLTDAEVMTVYLALIRLKDMERMAEKQDWETLAEYNPPSTPEDDQ